MRQFIITKLNKFDETKISLVGGKAIGLWKFSHLNVPKWFVLTTDFFDNMYEQEQELLNTLIVNACECEPFITCDYRLIMEQTLKLINGTKNASIHYKLSKIAVYFIGNRQ